MTICYPMMYLVMAPMDYINFELRECRKLQNMQWKFVARLVKLELKEAEYGFWKGSCC